MNEPCNFSHLPIVSISKCHYDLTVFYHTTLVNLKGNESKITFTGIEGSGELQWVSFYYQSTLQTRSSSVHGFDPDD